MDSTGKKIAKNASVMMVSQLITWGLTLLVTIALPRYLGAESIGKYALSGSLLAIMSIFTNFGMERMMTVQVARSREKLVSIFGTALFLRFGLYIIGLFGLTIYVRALNLPVDTVTVIAIFAVSNLMDQTTTLVGAALQGLERMEYISIASIASKFFYTVTSLTLLALKQGLFAIALVSIGSAFINLAILLIALSRLEKIRFSFDRRIVGWILKSSIAYMLTSLFLVLYQKMDIVVISWLANEKEIGWYSASSTLFGSLLFVPTIFMTAVFPAMARLFLTETNKAAILVQKSFYLLLLLGVPIGLGMVSISGPIVLLLYGPDFQGTAPILAIMGIVMIFTYLNIMLGQYMVSINRQNTWTIVIAIATALTIPLDLLFMPWCRAKFGNGAIGGGLSFVVTEMSMAVAGMFLIPRGILGWENFRQAGKIIISGAIMAFVVWQLRGFFLGIPIISGAAIYLAAILLLRVIPNDDRALLKNLLFEILSRFTKGRVKLA